MPLIVPRLVIASPSDLESLSGPTAGEIGFDDTEDLFKFYDGTRWNPGIWTNVTFTGTWVNFGGAWQTCQYRKASDGMVQLRGAAKSGTAGTAMFTLPAGFRPPADVTIAVVDASAASTHSLTVTSAGVVTPHTSAGNTLVSVSGMQFSVH